MGGNLDNYRTTSINVLQASTRVEYTQRGGCAGVIKHHYFPAKADVCVCVCVWKGGGEASLWTGEFASDFMYHANRSDYTAIRRV